MALQGPLVPTFNNRCLLRWCVTHQRQQIAPWVLVSFVTFSGVSSDESIESQSGTLSRIGDPLGPLEKATASPTVFEAPELLPKKHPLGDAKNGSLPLPQFCFFFFRRNNNKKNRGSLLAYTVVQRMQIVICIVWFWRFPPWLCRCNMSFYQKICLEMEFLSYTPLTVPSTRASSLHQQQPGGT